MVRQGEGVEADNRPSTNHTILLDRSKQKPTFPIT
jgi:hypothetical protein